MSDFSATDVAFSGFRFVRERPRAVAVWSAAQVVVSLIIGGLVVAVMGPALGQLQGFNRQQPADPTQALAVLSQVLPMLALLIPFGLVLYGVIYATIARAVLRPAEDAMAYIRFGPDELRQILLLLLWFVIVICAEIGGVLLVAIPTAILSLIAKPLAGLGILFFLAVCAAAIYCAVRLSLSSAMTFDRKRVDLFGSWALTKGQFWKMLGVYLLVVLLAIVVSILVGIISAAVAAVLGGIGGLTAMFARNVTSLADFFAPARLAVTVIQAIAAPLYWALFLMPPVEIYRHLSGAADPALDPSTFD